MTTQPDIGPSRPKTSDMAGLRARVAKGAGLMMAARFAVRALGLVNTLIIARLLAPEDFGLIAIGVTTMQLLQGFSDVGIAQAVIRFRDADRNDLDTLFTLSALRGAIVAAILIALAPVAAHIYGDPRVAGVFVGLALYPLATGLLNPRFFEFERDLDFSKDFWATTANKLVSVAVTVGVALAFRSYWAIVLGLVCGALAQLILSYALRPFRPRVSLASFRKVFAFSGWVAGVSFLAALNNKLDALIVARLTGEASAGHFYMGVQLTDLPTNELAAPMARAFYPGFSSLEGDERAMRAGFLQGVEALGAIALPAAFGLGFVAQDAVPLLLGEKWRAAADAIEIMAPAMGFLTLFTATQYYAMALDRTRDIVIREAIFFVLRTPLFIWATLEFGLMGAVTAFALTGLCHGGLNLALYARLAKRPFYEPLWAARRSLFACALMSGYFLAIGGGAAAEPSAPEQIAEATARLFRLAADIAAGAVIYLSALYLSWRIEGAPDGFERAALNLVKAKLGR